VTDEQTLTEMLLGSSWHRSALEAVAASGAPAAWIAAGAIRDLVWDERFGAGFDPAAVKDIDVVFLDPEDLRPARDRDVETTLLRLAPDLPWEAKNQAAVHLWYAERFGTDVEPLTSIEDAVGTFPETATAVAARLRGDRVEILAPLGLTDLLAGVWRRNPRRVSVEEAIARIDSKQPSNRWPRVQVIPP
jgi:uncharacterized protein